MPTSALLAPPSRLPARTIAGTVAALSGGLLLAPLTAVSADAHVRVVAETAVPGSYTALTVRVPNESEDASTTRVQLQLPQDTPFSSVRTQPVPGWTARVTRAPLPAAVEVGGTTLTEAPRTVTWTADGDAGIGAGQYQDFALSVGPLPAAGTVLLPAIQTYSDGEVVRWDQPASASGEEPEHPAPVLAVSAAAEQTAPPSDARPVDPAARWLGGSALVIALLAAAAGGLALVRTRQARP